ncbi:hypothetical protein B484DRAFT_402816 [Ochromonadaceae sp. CCMP2298]|nr:hypothetical protein B484DRAFT_402816 [Ochromonadaceae sp. CCMP2298]
MSAPHYFGGFELGFLLAKTVDDWPNIHPFHEWMHNWGGYDKKMLENASCHAEMYVSLMASDAISVNNQTGIVDKTPAYVYDLDEVMRRAPGVPVVVSHKTRENQEHSFLNRMSNRTAQVEERMRRLESGVARAQKLFPAGVKIVQIESIEACVRETQLNNNTVPFPNCTQASVTMQDAFTFLGMVWDDDYFTLSAYHDKKADTRRMSSLASASVYATKDARDCSTSCSLRRGTFASTTAGQMR